MSSGSEPIVTFIGQTTFRPGSNIGDQIFGIKQADRRHHLYTIGKTGTGKSTLLKTLMGQDIRHGEGFALFDPHGDLAESVVALVPPERQGDLIYLNTPDASRVWHFNPLSGIPCSKHQLAAAGLVDVFKKLWSDDWGPRLEHLVRNVVLTLLETPDASFGLVPRMLADRELRKRIIPRLSNKEVCDFWQYEYDRYSPRFRAVVIAPLQNKVGAFLTDPLLKQILTGRRSSFDLREVMDDGKILVVNLSKGQIGEGPASLLGSLLVSSLSLAGLSRAEVPEESRRDFYLYLDEFHTFATLSLATMLSELRKYRVSLVLAHQYLGQLEHEVADAVIGNAGTIICFRVGAKDAPLLARELGGRFTPEDLVQLPNFHIYLRLLIQGEISRAFSASTLSPEDRSTLPLG